MRETLPSAELPEARWTRARVTVCKAEHEHDTEAILLSRDVRESYGEDGMTPGQLQGRRCPSAGAAEAGHGGRRKGRVVLGSLLHVPLEHTRPCGKGWGWSFQGRQSP